MEDAPNPDARNGVFARIGEVFCTGTEDRWVREHAGQVLLDFQVRAYEQDLLDFAQEAEAIHDADRARGIPGGLAFAAADVADAFSRPQDLSRYERSWLDFYDPDAIAARQERWAREDALAVRERKNRPRAKVGRNDPCPCGSGRKYKKCCLS